MIDFIGMTNDNSIILAIVAINMTIIGLTSLAESKTIVGVDYGKFLIQKYKVAKVIRIYHLLILFALINVLTLFGMFINHQVIRSINLFVLVLSLVFAIYYFFAYILIENRFVKKQVYEAELLGMYYDCDKMTTFEPDLITKVGRGWRTEKRLSSSVVAYFDYFTNESQMTFEEIFSPDSILYSGSKRILNVWDKKYGVKPYDYSAYEGYQHISHEFFILYRYSELQEKWLLEILRIFNTEYTQNCYDLRLDNMIRIMAHINRFGRVENIYSYKFLEYLTKYIVDSLIADDSTRVSDSDRYKKGVFLLELTCEYVFKTIGRYKDYVYISTALSLFKQLLLDTDKKEIVQVNDRLDIIARSAGLYRSDEAEVLITDLYNHYINTDIKNKRDISSLRSKINDNINGSSRVLVSKEQLFG